MSDQNNILETFRNMRPGAVYRVAWRRGMKTRKTAGDVACEKAVSALVRAGVDYDAQKAVQAKRETGELPAENQGLPWGEWADDVKGTILHKGKRYLRLYPHRGAIPLATFFLDGKEVSPDDVKPLCLASEFQDRADADCFTLGLDNLESLERVELID